MAVLRALPGGRILLPPGPPESQVPGAAHLLKKSGSCPGSGSGLVQAQRYGRYDDVHGCLCRKSGGCAKASGLPGGVRSQLPASDAPSGFPGGKERRRLCSGGFYQSAGGLGNHGRPVPACRYLPQERDQHLPGFCHEPYLRGALLGQAGTGRRARV